tara:strand:- start:296 stop:703 length:408 start_codon:yes stop_codon:yes gene_type:complete
MSPDAIGLGLAEMIMPFGVALLALVITLMFKDYATGIAKGMAFKMNRDFQEGDKVILDGERALIVKIGNATTVFGIHKSSGDLAGHYCWRYVPNERISMLKLEKVIFDEKPTQNEKAIQQNGQKIAEHIKGEKDA